MEIECPRGHRFYDSETRGKVFKDGIHFLLCPFCDEGVPIGKNVIGSLQEQTKRLDELSKKLESLVKNKENKPN